MQAFLEWEVVEAQKLGRGRIDTAYPFGVFDRSLVVKSGNRQLYGFMGEYVYLSLYKMVRESDIPKLQAAVSACDAEGQVWVEECVHILGSDKEYETYILRIRRCPEPEEYEIEFQNVSACIRHLEEIDKQLDIVKDYLTIAGNIMFSYNSDTDHFLLFWSNYEQRIDLADCRFAEWETKVLKNGLVVGEDENLFKSFCNAVRIAEHEQTYTLHGSFLGWGDVNTYRVKFEPRTYKEQNLVMGIWTILNEQTGNEAEDYVAGNYLDSLTKVMSRKGIIRYAEAAVESGEQLALIMLDVDNFKNINDSYGHLFGDTVLAAVADVIKKVIGDQGVVGRLGGDEFLIILDNYGDELNLRSYLRSIRANINALFMEKVGENHLSCSIGVSRSPIDADKFRELYMLADKTLYLAKEKGKNCYIIYEEELHGRFRLNEDNSNLTEIRKAFYQEKDMFRLNQYLADMVLRGREVMPAVLEQLASILAMDRMVVFWGEKKWERVCSYPLSLMQEESEETLPEDESYQELFHDDILLLTNIHSLEYTIPKAYEAFQNRNTASALQHFLRDRDGAVCGYITLEVGKQRRYPKLAVQLFENTCRMINAVLLQEQKALDKQI